MGEGTAHKELMNYMMESCRKINRRELYLKVLTGMVIDLTNCSVFIILRIKNMRTGKRHKEKMVIESINVRIPEESESRANHKELTQGMESGIKLVIINLH